MVYRDALFATIALALSSLAMAAILTTDVYSRAAQAEASGVGALTSQVQGDSATLCWNQEADGAGRTVPQ